MAVFLSYPTTGAGSASAPFQLIEVVEATSSTSAFSNSVGYVPLEQGQNDSISFQFVSSISGDLEIALTYCMSTAHTGNVELRLDSIVNSDGSSPDTPVTSGTAFTVTPGNDVLQHTVSSSDSAEFSLSLSEGDFVYGNIYRPSTGSDTHTGDFRVLQVTLRAP